MLQKLWGLIFKSIGEEGKKRSQNTLMYLSLLVMLGILLILWSNLTTTKKVDLPMEPNNQVQPTISSSSPVTGYEEELETSLERILSLIDGVGKVEVKITFEQTREYIYLYNSSVSESQTDENDKAGGIRNLKEYSREQDLVVLRGQDGQERPVTQTEIYPEIKGVLVVAQGAENPKTNAELMRAVNTVLGVDLHDICILPYKR